MKIFKQVGTFLKTMFCNAKPQPGKTNPSVYPTPSLGMRILTATICRKSTDLNEKPKERKLFLKTTFCNAKPQPWQDQPVSLPDALSRDANYDRRHLKEVSRLKLEF